MKLRVGGEIPDDDVGDIRVISKTDDQDLKWKPTPDDDSEAIAAKLMLTPEGAESFCGRTLYKRYRYNMK